MIPVYAPYLPPKALHHAHEALDSGWISSHGNYLEKVQSELQRLLEVKHVLLTNNGTTATHLVAKALMRKRPDIKTIIAPNNVYVAAINSFLFDNYYDIVTVDADIHTWNYKLDSLCQTIEQFISNNIPIAVLAVHNIGNVLDVIDLKKRYPTVEFVEDNCEGFLGHYKGTHTGKAGIAGSISFFGNKNVTSGEGGAVLTNDTDLYRYLHCIHGQGQSAKRFVHCELGYNYRMTNIQAAILYGQLQCLPEIFDLKNQLFTTYRDHIKDREDVVAQTITPDTRHSNWMFGIRVPKSKGYDHAEQFFKDKSIEIRPMFYPLSTHQHIVSNPKIQLGDETNAIILNKTCFILPSYPGLSSGEVKYILKTLDEYLLEIK